MNNVQSEIDAQEPESVMIETLDQFVKALHYWHQHKVQVLQHMKQIPPGSTVEVDDGVIHTLDGDFLKGFQTGVDFALSQMGELPFQAEVDFNSEAPVITDSAATQH